MSSLIAHRRGVYLSELETHTLCIPMQYLLDSIHVGTAAKSFRLLLFRHRCTDELQLLNSGFCRTHDGS